ncbi:cell division inhibitor SulA [Alteromonadaceae bacterium 2753L.S.0a.02]|nr:cell division inhibitor SulA [Alteromonadaceae bacterium 2753L.S.0a.02]
MAALKKSVNTLSASSTLQPRRNHDAGITEIILSVSEPPYALALPMLAHLSRNTGGRWLTWVTSTPLSKHTLEEYGFNIENLRVIYAISNEQAKWITWEALQNGNSDAVVASLDGLSSKELQDLEAASLSGGCRGLLLRLRG